MGLGDGRARFAWAGLLRPGGGVWGAVGRAGFGALVVGGPCCGWVGGVRVPGELWIRCINLDALAFQQTSGIIESCRV